ncbi:hypothetical protein J4E89_006875 [Alternaria sp. Ai002NY15]|nr:hypothetical protein J4E89_006875 [Alternaria sp. Ai002NY15]
MVMSNYENIMWEKELQRQILCRSAHAITTSLSQNLTRSHILVLVGATYAIKCLSHYADFMFEIVIVGPSNLVLYTVKRHNVPGFVLKVSITKGLRFRKRDKFPDHRFLGDYMPTFEQSQLAFVQQRASPVKSKVVLLEMVREMLDEHIVKMLGAADVEVRDREKDQID